MATESIFHNVVINNPKDIKQFIDALDESERDLRRRTDLYENVVFDDQDAIRQLMAVRKICNK